MKWWMKIGIIIIVTFTILFFGVYFYVEYKSKEMLNENYSEENWQNPLGNMAIKDADYIYEADKQEEAEKIYVTILKQTGKRAKYNFEDMNIFKQEDEKLKLEVFFESGEKKLLGNSIIGRESNAFIEIRGKESEKAPQNSFKIRLFDREGLWHNQNIVNLNKYYFDSLRIRSKLSFDYFKIIPNITSFRTSFVNLYIKDLTDEKQAIKFEDYGLFTQMEQPNKLFLKNHGLDANGQLYQAESFDFSRYPDVIMDKDNKKYSEKDFEEILEIKGSDDHKKFIEMLEAVNDYDKEINEVVDDYFDRENYLTWVAVNILFDSYKNSSSDFLLYSPLNGDKWYFMPWDYDEAWNFEEDRPKWKKGLSVYWDNVLHRRFFEDKKNVEALSEKIEAISNMVNKEQTQKFLDSYYNIILSNITKIGDLKYLPVTLEEYKSEYEDIPNMTERNKFYYYELLENPMPFYLLESKRNGNKYIFQWSESYDIQGDDLYYDFEISDDRDFSNIIKQVKGIKGLKIEIDGLEDNIYYWRIIARDEKGNTQIAYNIERNEYGEKYYGIKQLETDKVKELTDQDFKLEKIEEIETPETEEIKVPEVNEIITKDEIDKKHKKHKKHEVPATYKLKQGETLFSTSMKFYGSQAKIEEIKKINNIEDINNISTGKLLKLP